MTKRMPLKKGSKFGERITLGKQNYDKGSRELCKCSCGTEVRVSRSHLVQGLSKMCISCANRKRNLKHGFAAHNNHTRFYKIYIGIKDRCTREGFKEYHRYGGRGIICERETFEQFKNDMYGSYLEHCKEYGVKQTTIDRINNDGNYCKENCRWATYKEQGKDNYLHKRSLLFN